MQNQISNGKVVRQNSFAISLLAVFQPPTVSLLSFCPICQIKISKDQQISCPKKSYKD